MFKKVELKTRGRQTEQTPKDENNQHFCQILRTLWLKDSLQNNISACDSFSNLDQHLEQKKYPKKVLFNEEKQNMWRRYFCISAQWSIQCHIIIISLFEEGKKNAKYGLSGKWWSLMCFCLWAPLGEVCRRVLEGFPGCSDDCWICNYSITNAAVKVSLIILSVCVSERR